MKTENLCEELVGRFFRYVSIESQSDAQATILPSTPGQYSLAQMLARELRELGLDDVVLDDHAIVTAVRRGNSCDAPAIGFIAHLDTVDVGLSPAIRPQIFHFDGQDLCLNKDLDIWLRVEEHSELLPWVGKDIITGDGTSVLGADNKAAIAVIMTLLSRLGDDDQHGDIHVAFVPDEEIGLRGAKALDLSRFACDFAYTIDCCELGEVVFETFNAASVEVTFSGVSAHPMSAFNVLVNPMLMAIDFIGLFDRGDTPENTHGREGFFWFKNLVADDSTARLTGLIRDFDRAGYEQRKRAVVGAADKIQALYPSGSLDVAITDTYGNIADALSRDGLATTLLMEAIRSSDIEAKVVPMRGGTDGAVLSDRGIPTPNFFTGAHNFHSRFEFLPIPAFEASFRVASTICAIAAHKPSWGSDERRRTAKKPWSPFTWDVAQN
jgi:tripeptide aminopeptidase